MTWSYFLFVDKSDVNNCGQDGHLQQNDEHQQALVR